MVPVVESTDDISALQSWRAVCLCVCVGVLLLETDASLFLLLLTAANAVSYLFCFASTDRPPLAST